jgi:hypothetical protein
MAFGHQDGTICAALQGVWSGDSSTGKLEVTLAGLKLLTLNLFQGRASHRPATQRHGHHSGRPSEEDPPPSTSTRHCNLSLNRCL